MKFVLQWQVLVRYLVSPSDTETRRT